MLKMKNILKRGVIVLIVLFLSINIVLAVGIKWFTEGESVQENSEKCINYGAYNPSDKDIKVKVEEIKKIQEDLHLRFIDNKTNQGKGKVVKQGVLESSCELVMFLDADLGIPIEEIQKFIPELDNGYDIVIASRFVPGLRIVRPVPWHRRIMEKIFRLLRMAIVNGWNVKDTQCGFKAFTAEAAEKVFQMSRVTGWGFDVEVLALAKNMGYRIKEIPVHWVNDVSSTVGASAYLKTLVELCKIRWWLWISAYEALRPNNNQM